MFLQFRNHLPLFHAPLDSLGAPFPGCSCLPHIPVEREAGEMSSQTQYLSYLPELKASVGIYSCAGLFLHHNHVLPPGTSEQSPADHKLLKDKAAASLALPAQSPNHLAVTGPQPETPGSLPFTSLPV